MDVKKRISDLSKLLRFHQQKYYVDSTPVISDTEYDRLFDELLMLENKYSQFALPNSPTRRVGSDLDNKFPERAHTIPVLSLDKEYSSGGIMKWIEKTGKEVSSKTEFVIEEKMDGASIVLYYKRGELKHALTRGNGEWGNDVTENIRTINDIPLVLEKKIDLVVRGEIFIKKDDFNEYNLLFDNRYSNPRNLAAGSLRNIRSSTVAKIPLRMYANEGHMKDELSHLDILEQLQDFGFRITPNPGFFSDNPEGNRYADIRLPGISIGKISDIPGFISMKASLRDTLPYEIDGLVIKINSAEMRNELGITSHHPKWAIAYKFESPLAVTAVKDIVIQVGRNGRITPVAILEPVQIAGSVVSRATLHNQEYIDILELGRGDKVTISKRGDIIPAVENVLEKSELHPEIFRFPGSCPFCNSKLKKDGAHHFCKNRDCPERRRRELSFFVSKERMDIDTLGEKTVFFLYEKGFIRNIADIYIFDYKKLVGIEGFKEKRVRNIIKSVEESKKRPFERVLVSLGFEGLSTFAAKELIRAGYNSFEKIIAAASSNNPDIFTKIEGFGESTAELIIEHFSDKANIELIRKLGKLGLAMKTKAKTGKKYSKSFEGQTWVITGTFSDFNPRSKAAEEIELRGGRVSTSVSSRTTFLLAGSSPGSKLDKAKKLGIEIVDEDRFKKMLD